MRTLAYILLLFVGVVIAGAGCGNGDGAAKASNGAAGHDHAAMTAGASAPAGADTSVTKPAGITRYRCPMHPDFIRDEPGSCGICGMTLVAFSVGGGEHESTVTGQAVVTLSDAQRQRIGVRLAVAQRIVLVNHVRTVGRVAADERRVAHIHSRSSGWVQRLHVDFTGQRVRAGDPLLDIYSPELVSAQQEYLVAYRTAATQPELLNVARQRLRLLNLTDDQITRLEQSGETQTTLTIYAPRGGTVVTKNVSTGQQISPEIDLYTIADLSSIWVLADAYEADLPFVRVGQRAEVLVPASPKGKLTGRVTFVSPVVDPTTRTASFRSEFANADGTLRPGSFVDVALDVPLGNRLVVPRESILDSGTRKVIFVEKEPGVYEPREVTLGVTAGNNVEVRDGIHPGERIVASATFLIDSESRLRAAMSAPSGGHQHGGGGQ